MASNSIPGLVDSAGAPGLAPQTVATIIGVVTDVLEPRMTQRNEWMVTCRICDHSTVGEMGLRNGMKVRVFRRAEDGAPAVPDGGMAIFRNFKRLDFRGEPLLISGFGSSTISFSMEAIPVPAFMDRYLDGSTTMTCVCWPPTSKPTTAEMLHVAQLKASLGELITTYTASKTASRTTIPDQATAVTHAPLRARKFSLIQDLQYQNFYDLIVEVVKIYPSNYAYVEVHVTDYTENKNLYDHAAPEESGSHVPQSKSLKNDFNGPYGQRILVIEVNYPHRHYISEKVKPGDIIELKNVRVKMGRSNRMEANLFQDHLYPERIYVGKIKASGCDEGRELLTRRSAYRNKRSGFTMQADQAQSNSKASKKKRRRAEEQQAMEAKVANRSFDAIAVKGNQYVQCAAHDIRLSKISELVAFRGSFRLLDNTEAELPFTNQKRKCQVRAIDYYPPQLSAWTTAANDDDDEDDDSSQRWCWDFCLLIEDAARSGEAPGTGGSSNDMWLHVSHSAAQYLLDLDAVDLSRDNGRETLSKLEQKVDILCGNLRELKEGHSGTHEDTSADQQAPAADYWAVKLSNVPFTCYIQESGQRLDVDDLADADEAEWIRIYDLFETRIL